MRLSDVLKDEIKQKGIEVEAIAEYLKMSVDDYLNFEDDKDRMAEKWANVLVNIATYLEVPVSRLLSKTGKFGDIKQGRCGKQIELLRKASNKNISIQKAASIIRVSESEYQMIEDGKSELEFYGPLFLGFSEKVNSPIFNILCPNALLFDSKDSENILEDIES